MNFCRSKGWKLLLFLFFILAISISSDAQESMFLPLTKLETKDGLSSPNVRKIVQDKYGFMWFATQDGLNRFDGVKFVRYISGSPEVSHAILESDVYDLAFEENGNYLWCLTAYGGLSKIDIATGLVMATFPVATHAPTKGKLWFRCMSLKKNLIYIGTNEGFVIRFNLENNKTEVIADINGRYSSKGSIDKIYTDDYNRVWLMIQNSGIRVLDNSLERQIDRITTKDLLLAAPLTCQFNDFGEKNDELLICTSAGLVTIGIKNIIPISAGQSNYGIPAPVYESNLHCISISGNYILLSGNMGLYMTDITKKKSRQILFSKNYDDRNWLTLTNSIFQSGQNIWIGSQYGVGWIKNINTIFTGVFNSMNGNGIKIEHSTTLCNLTDSTLAVCADDGLYFSNHISGSIDKFSIPDFYYHAFTLPGNHLIASGFSKGLQLIDKNGKSASLNAIYPELVPIKNDLLISSALLDDSVCFMASQREKGIYIWNYKKKIIHVLSANSRPAALKNNIVNRLFLDSKKRLWIIGDNTVSVYNHYTGSIEHLDLYNPRNKAPLSINMDICEAGGRYWLATYGTGIVELSGTGKINRVYSAHDGINNLGLYKIFRVNDSMLVASSNNGLSALNINNGKIINYFEEDGLQSNNFEETSGCENDQYIFLGGLKGFTKINKARFSVQKEFYNLYFSSIRIHAPNKINDYSNLFLKDIEIPSNSTQVIVGFSNLNYIIPEKIIFQYRLKEVSEKWNALGTQRFISLTSLPPGVYHLQIQASNEDGAWSGPKELILVFLPKWYQTWWFKLSLALLFIASVYALYRLRVSQLKKEQEIRSKLASDLHDDLGSTLNSVKVYANLALMEKEKDKYVVKIKDSIQEAITGVKDMIWVLDDSKDTIEDLLARVSQFAASLCEANGMRYKQEFSEEARHFKPGREEKRNLYMILKEAVNNACKYSGATEMSIAISVNKKKPEIRIKDNGKGFDLQTATAGNGLKNMKLRGRQIRYTVTITSSPGNGTAITLEKI